MPNDVIIVGAGPAGIGRLQVATAVADVPIIASCFCRTNEGPADSCCADE